MEAESESSIQAAHDRQVPDDLLQKLHVATERFHAAKKDMEDAMGTEDYSHQQTIDRAADELRAAEREVEEISLQIHGSLKPPPPETPNH
jgi:hypothetical protein